MINHIRGNAIAYVALFVALGGTAFAATKIGSKQIKTNAVKQKHIADNAVFSGEIGGGGVGTTEIADGAVTAPKVANGAIGSAEVSDDSLTAADIDEASLTKFTAAANAHQSGTLALAGGGTVALATDINPPAAGILFASASLTVLGNGGDDDRVACQLEYDPLSGPAAVMSEEYTMTVPDTANDDATITLSGAIPRPAGITNVYVVCFGSVGNLSVAGRDLITWSVPD